ncbi:MAG: NAD(P)-dependent oxidoreductase [Erysipelotrichaceae bacterium]
MKIGFIGIGVMGFSMAKNLLDKGYKVNVYNRTLEKAQPLAQFGATICSSVEACCEDTDVNIAIVGMPQDVEEVFQKIIACASKGSIAIDMTTSSPQLATDLYKLAKTKGISLLDAPVSGGDIGAKLATLSIMVGGDKNTYQEAMPLFEAMGTNIVYCGESGMGQHTKMANQIAIAGCISGLSEALIYAQTMGLDANTLLDAISKGAAGSWQMSNNGPKMIQEDYAPGFFIKHFVKDMNLANNEAMQHSLDLPILKETIEHYQQMIAKNQGELGTQALIDYYKKN